jgi:hypothetical protein
MRAPRITCCEQTACRNPRHPAQDLNRNGRRQNASGNGDSRVLRRRLPIDSLDRHDQISRCTCLAGSALGQIGPIQIFYWHCLGFIVTIPKSTQVLVLECGKRRGSFYLLSTSRALRLAVKGLSCAFVRNGATSVSKEAAKPARSSACGKFALVGAESGRQRRPWSGNTQHPRCTPPCTELRRFSA